VVAPAEELSLRPMLKVVVVKFKDSPTTVFTGTFMGLCYGES
jgi:hypothetical protein